MMLKSWLVETCISQWSTNYKINLVTQTASYTTTTQYILQIVTKKKKNLTCLYSGLSLEIKISK